jgi:hypothetical protein
MSDALVESLIGGSAEASPFVVEKVAIDATNALRSAEVGLRTLRARPLLRRLWEIARGTEQERAAALGADLLFAQRAALTFVEAAMAEQTRTSYCLNRVLVNLHAVNRDLDELAARTARLEGFVTQALPSLREGVRQLVAQESQRLAGQIEAVRGLVQREAAVRRLNDLYLGGGLYPGVGKTLGGALYLVGIACHFTDETAPLQRKEWAAGLAVVRQKLGDVPVYLPDLLLEDVASAEQGALETVAYLTSGESGPHAHVLNALAQRRLAGVSVDERAASEVMAVAKKLHDPDRLLGTLLTRQWKLAEQVARELLDLLREG